MAKRPRHWRDTIAAIESDYARAQTRDLECERGSEAREMMTWLPHAYNHPELREKVLLHYIVSEFLESLQLYSTLAVFGREAFFDQQHYTEYHPVMGVEWFLKSFFMGDKYKGLLPILLRFIKSAEKRVTARRKKKEYLDKTIEEAQQYLELPEKRLAVPHGVDLSLRRGGKGSMSVVKSLRNPSRGTCSQPGCNREVEEENTVALPSSFLYEVENEGAPNTSNVNIGVVSSTRSVSNIRSLQSSSGRQPIPTEAGSPRNDHPVEPLNLRKTTLITREGEKSHQGQTGGGTKSFPIEEVENGTQLETPRNRPESPIERILNLHKQSSSAHPPDIEACPNPNNNPTPRRSPHNLHDSILALEQEALKIIDLPRNAGPSAEGCPISSKPSSAGCSRKPINETGGPFAVDDQPMDLTNAPPNKSRNKGTCPQAKQQVCARGPDSNQPVDPTRNSVKTSCPMSVNGQCLRQSGDIIPIETRPKAVPSTNSQSIHETTRLPVEYEQNPNLIPFGPEERPVGWQDPEEELLVPYGPLDIYEHLEQATKEIENERYDYIYLDYMREQQFKADKEAWLAERARKAAEEEARKNAIVEREEREERARRAALADPEFYKCKFSDKRCLGRKRANSISQEQKIVLNKQNRTFHGALEDIELKEDFKNKYLADWKRPNPVIVVDSLEGEDEDGNESRKLGSPFIPARRISPYREQEDKDDEVIRKINEMLRVTYQPRTRKCLPKTRSPKGC